MKAETKAKGLDVITYTGEGYQTMMSFGSWKIAMVEPPTHEIGQPITVMSRHLETDEVFVLLKGNCTIYTAGMEAELSEIEETVMEPFKLYNIRRGTWHARLLPEGAQLLIVENEDTGNHNSEFAQLTKEIEWNV